MEQVTKIPMDSKLIQKHVFQFSLADWYDLRYTTKESDFYNETLWNDLKVIENDTLVDGSLTPELAGNQMFLVLGLWKLNANKESRNLIFLSLNLDRGTFEWDKKYYLAIKAYDALNQSSAISNVAFFKNSNLSQDNEVSGGAIFGIIVFILGFLSFSGFIAYRYRQNDNS